MKKYMLALVMLTLLTGCSEQHRTFADKVSWEESTENCGSGGCGLTISDSNGRAIFEGLTPSKPEFIPFSTDGHRDFYIFEKHYLEAGGSEMVKVFYRFNQTLQAYQEVNLSYYR